MAGYMSVLKNNVFDGRFVNGTNAPVANGTIMKVDATGTKLILPGAVDADFKGVAVDKTTIFGNVAANEILVTGVSATQYYFVECQFDINDSEEYDTTAYTTPAKNAFGEDAFLRAHPIEIGERFYVSGTTAKGTAVSLKANGTMA